MEKLTPLERVLKILSPPKLAEALGIKRQAVYAWRHVPIGRVKAVEKLTGIPREELRPDIYA